MSDKTKPLRVLVSFIFINILIINAHPQKKDNVISYEPFIWKSETVEKMNSYILESDNITGPWKLVVYMKDFGEQGYFLNIPSKFISKDGKCINPFVILNEFVLHPHTLLCQ